MGKKSNEHFSQFIQRNIIYQNAENKNVHRPLSELKIIAQNWKALENRLQNQISLQSTAPLLILASFFL